MGSRVESGTIETTTLFSHDDGELVPSGAPLFDLPKLSGQARRQLEREGANV